MNKPRYTHHAKVFGVPAYYDVNTGELKGKNWFYHIVIEWAVFPLQGLMIAILSLDENYEPAWEIWQGEPLTAEEQERVNG